jgi:predicted transcriptional regulator
MINRQFREQVEAFIAAYGFKPTEFGRQALGDPSFVMTLRRGRSPRLATAEKVLSFMEEFKQTDRKRARQRRSA